MPMRAVQSTTLLPSSDAVEIPVYDLGGSGPVVLVAHAAGFHGLVYRPMVAALAGLRCVSVDLRGHGDSRAPAGLDYRWEGLADDLEVALAHLRASGLVSGPVLGFGHSMGAAALLMVEQRQPGTFRSLFCYEPVIHPPASDHPPVERSGWLERTLRRRASFDSWQAAIDNYRAKPPYRSFAEEALEAYVRHGFALGEDGRIHLKCRPEVEAKIYAMGPKHRAYERLGEVRCPVTLARGGISSPGPSAWAETLAARMPNCRLEVFAGIGHLGPLEEPAIVAASVGQTFAAAPA